MRPHQELRHLLWRRICGGARDICAGIADHASLEDYASILMFDGGNDKPGERYGAFREKLNQLGLRNDFQMFPDAKHGEWGKLQYRPKFVAVMDEFLRDVLGEVE